MEENNDILDSNELKPEKRKFTGKEAGKAWKLEQAEDRIEMSRKLLFVFAVFMLIPLYGIFTSPYGVDMFSVFFLILLAGIYLTGGFTIRKYPIPTLAITLGIYLIIIIINVVVEPASLSQGMLWKVLFITGLSMGLYNAILAKRLRRELGL